MMRILSIIAIVASLILTVESGVFVGMVDSSRSAASYAMMSDYSSESSYGSSDFDMYHAEAAGETTMAGIVSLVILLFLESVFVLSLIKIKTKTMKILSIIGMSLTGILTVVLLGPITSPGGASWDEVGPIYILFGIVALAFSIIGTIHSFRMKA